MARWPKQHPCATISIEVSRRSPRHTVLPTSSATSSAPARSTATPSGGPSASPSPLTNPSAHPRPDLDRQPRRFGAARESQREDREQKKRLAHYDPGGQQNVNRAKHVIKQPAALPGSASLATA